MAQLKGITLEAIQFSPLRGISLEIAELKNIGFTVIDGNGNTIDGVDINVLSANHELDAVTNASGYAETIAVPGIQNTFTFEHPDYAQKIFNYMPSGNQFNSILIQLDAFELRLKVVDRNHEPIEGATCRVLNASNNVPYFDLVDDRIDVAHNANFQGAEITYEFLYYSESWGSTHNGFIVKRTSNTNGFFIFRLSTTGTLYFDFNGSGNRWDTGYVLPLNEWKRITLTRTSSGRKLYVDGNLIASTASAGTVPTATGIMRFGADSQSLQLFFGGNMSDIRIWNKERTPEEIAADWNKRLMGNEANLVEYWKLDEGTGTLVNGLTNDGTIYGATWAEVEDLPIETGIAGYDPTPYDSQTTNANGLTTLNYQINLIHGLEVTLPGKRRFIMPFKRTARGLLDWQVMLSDYLATFATDRGNILINSEPENNDANFLIE